HDPMPEEIDPSPPNLASAPCVAGDRVYYVNTRAEVVCAAAAGGPRGEGRVVWAYDLIGRLGVYPTTFNNGCGHPRGATSPLVFGDAVYVVTGNGVEVPTGTLPAPEAPSFVALDRHTGRLLWQSSLPGRGVMRGQWASPAVAVVRGRAQVLFP